MIALREAGKALEETEKTLAIAMERLREVEQGIEKLESLLRAGESNRVELEKQKQVCEERMGRAVRLIAGLAEEQKRWTIAVNNMKVSLKNVIGDILISSGKIKYKFELFFFHPAKILQNVKTITSAFSGSLPRSLREWSFS